MQHKYMFRLENRKCARAGNVGKKQKLCDEEGVMAIKRKRSERAVDKMTEC